MSTTKRQINKRNMTRQDGKGRDGMGRKQQTLSFDDLFLFSFSFTKINKQQKVSRKRPKFIWMEVDSGGRECIEGGKTLFMFRFWFIFWFWFRFRLKYKTPYTSKRFTYALISQLFLRPRVVRKSKLDKLANTRKTS